MNSCFFRVLKNTPFKNLAPSDSDRLIFNLTPVKKGLYTLPRIIDSRRGPTRTFFGSNQFPRNRLVGFNGDWMNIYSLFLENLYDILKEKKVRTALTDTFLLIFFVSAIFFTWFDYQITWIKSNGWNEGNEIMRHLWLDYGRWTLIPQFLVETSIATLSFFYYRKSKWLLLIFLVFSAWSIFAHYNGGMNWLWTIKNTIQFKLDYDMEEDEEWEVLKKLLKEQMKYYQK